MIIKKANLKWKEPLTPLDPKKVDGIALHHAEHPTCSIEDVHRWHQEKGWNGCGYNFFISKDGVIWEGRGYNVGAHTKDENSHLVGICFQGDYDAKDTTMPDAQFNAGVYLIELIQSKFPHADTVDGHKRWTKTACPGRFFPLNEMIVGRLRQKISQSKQDGVAAVDFLFKAGRLGNRDEWINKVQNVDNLEYIFIKWKEDFVK